MTWFGSFSCHGLGVLYFGYIGVCSFRKQKPYYVYAFKEKVTPDWIWFLVARKLTRGLPEGRRLSGGCWCALQGCIPPGWGHKGSCRAPLNDLSSAGDTWPLSAALNWWRLGSTENGEIEPNSRKGLFVTDPRLFCSWDGQGWPLSKLLPAFLSKAKADGSGKRGWWTAGFAEDPQVEEGEMQEAVSQGKGGRAVL